MAAARSSEERATRSWLSRQASEVSPLAGVSAAPRTFAAQQEQVCRPHRVRVRGRGSSSGSGLGLLQAQP